MGLEVLLMPFAVAVTGAAAGVFGPGTFRLKTRVGLHSRFDIALMYSVAGCSILECCTSTAAAIAG